MMSLRDKADEGDSYLLSKASRPNLEGFLLQIFFLEILNFYGKVARSPP